MAKSTELAPHEDRSPFTDKKTEPGSADLKLILKNTVKLWEHLEKYTMAAYPKAIGKWNYPGEKYGWSYRISDKKRVLVYLLPRKGFFKAGFVFGEKAFKQIMEDQISQGVKEELSSAKVYGEGRGIRIEVHDSKCIRDLEKLIGIKITN